MKLKQNQAWFKIEKIPKVNFQAMVPIFRSYGNLISKQGGSDYFKHVLWIFKDGTADLCYPREDFNKGISFLAKKAFQNQVWAEKSCKDIIKNTVPYYNFAKKIEKTSFSKLSNKKLADIYCSLIEYQRKSHNSGQIMTWLIDADKQLFSNMLLELLKEKIKKSKNKYKLSEIFSLLTTPEKPSFVEVESREALKITLLLKNTPQTKNLFLKNNAPEIIKNLSKINNSLKRKILSHYCKYLWLFYNYEGPVLELDYFLEVWKGLLTQNNIEKLLKEAEEKFSRVRKERANLMKEFNFSVKERRLFNIAKNIVWLKGWRKDCMYYGSYVLDKISKEIGSRLNLSIKQVRFFCDWEIKDALLKKKFDANELNRRYEFSIVYTFGGNKPLVRSGVRATKWLKKLKFEKEKIIKTNEIFGASAYPGKAKGVVKIVESVDDIKKMNQGDILLSETTYPALVPAMKKAAAIVTNAGGLTCHAAIVARELKIPCVVGTRIANRVLKDGDLVEVDADKGIVKRIK